MNDVKERYKKARKKLTSKVRRETKKGFIFKENFIPNIPKKPTEASIRYIEKKLKNWEKNVTYISDSQKVFKGKKAVEKQKQENIRKQKIKRLNKKRKKQLGLDYNIPSFSEIVIQNFRSHVIARFPIATHILNLWLNNVIAMYGKDDVAIMLQEASKNSLLIDYKIAYDKEKLMNHLADMLNFLPEIGEISKSQIIEALEQEEEWEMPL